MKFSNWATLRRVRNSSSFSLVSRGCMMLRRCSLCGHVIQPAVTSSVRNTWLASMRSSRWIPLTESVLMRAASSGRSTPNSTSTSVTQITECRLIVGYSWSKFYKPIILHKYFHNLFVLRKTWSANWRYGSYDDDTCKTVKLFCREHCKYIGRTFITFGIVEKKMRPKFVANLLVW